MGKFVIAAFVAFASLTSAFAEQGNATRGEQDSGACAPWTRLYAGDVG